MSWNNLKTDIVTLLNELTGIAEITSNPTSDFNGYPSIVVVQSDMESETETSRENLRTYIFDLLIYETAKDGVDAAINNVEEIVDKVVDKIDEEEAEGETRVVGSSLGTGYHLKSVKPIIGPFNYDDVHEIVVGQLSLQVEVSFLVESN